MKYAVHTVIQARIIVEAENETHAYGKAEGQALAILDRLKIDGRPIAAAREADEVKE